MRALIDVTCAHVVSQSRLKMRSVNQQQLRDLMMPVTLDYSQNPVRRSFSGSTGNIPCLTSSSQLYNYGRDRVLCGKEHFLLQGWKPDVVVPPDVSDAKVKELAGQGMCVASLGSILWAVYCVKQFPG